MVYICISSTNIKFHILNYVRQTSNICSIVVFVIFNMHMHVCTCTKEKLFHTKFVCVEFHENLSVDLARRKDAHVCMCTRARAMIP
jgi:hypothetical protein